MATLTLEQRVAQVEAILRQLQSRLDSQAPATNWLEGVIGSFRDEPAFDEVSEYGRAVRQSDRWPRGSPVSSTRRSPPSFPIWASRSWSSVSSSS